MEGLTVQELIDCLLLIEDKQTLVKVSDDDGNVSDLFIEKVTSTTVILGQFYED